MQYYISFEAFCTIEADCEEDARRLFELYLFDAPFYIEVDDSNVVIEEDYL